MLPVIARMVASGQLRSFGTGQARFIAPRCARFLSTRSCTPSKNFQSECVGKLRRSVGIQQMAWTERGTGLRTFAAAADPEVAPSEEKFTYQAEVDRLMDMIVHSLYSNREVFLRELVSNASDALDKARFVSLTRPEILKEREALEIFVKANLDTKTITIEDSGIGMTKDDLLSQLGTIARSGTRKFMEAVKEAKGDANLIGQFGVGFYSSFLVADKVTVQTKSPDDDQQWVWESQAGSHEYSIRPDTGDPLVRGTKITLFLKEDCVEFADSFKLKNLLKQYSEFISFPIQLYTSKRDPIKVVDDVATKKKQEAEDELAKKEEREATKVEDVMKTDYEETWDWMTQNDSKPLWTLSPKEVEKEQYDTFYKTTFGEFMEPMAHTHFNVEGTIEFTSLLFIPGMAPFEQDYMKKSKNIRLYVKQVFISDEFDDNLMPRYLSFIKGIVDSSDLPLNVSREILQENRVVRVIKKQLLRRSLDMIKDMAKREDDSYKTFWENFGKNLKLGIIEDSASKDTLASLMRFPSSKSGEELTGFDAYVDRMKKGQKTIYYIAADNMKAAKAAPFVEKLLNKDYEVLYLVDPIDEVCITNIKKYNEFDFVDVSKEELDLGEEEKEENSELQNKYAALTEFIKTQLGDNVEKVVVSTRLTNSPCIVVTSKFGWSANMEKIMKSQTMADNRAMEYMRGRKILEVNAEHPLIKMLKEEVLADPKSQMAKQMAELLYETSLLTSGFSVESPKDYADKVYGMMTKAVNGDEAHINEDGTETVVPEVIKDDDPWKK